jgi:hypothetical protein
LVAPAGMVIDPGAVTADELGVSVTTIPPEGAAPVSVTVPVTGAWPPTTVEALSE